MTGTVEQIVGRLGLPELGGCYFTFSNENNYTIWAVLKKCHEQRLDLQGHTTSCPGAPAAAPASASTRSSPRATQELTHPSVFLRFPLRDRPGEDPAGVDDHALDADQQRRGGRPARAALRPGRAGRAALLAEQGRHAQRRARPVRRCWTRSPGADAGGLDLRRPLRRAAGRSRTSGVGRRRHRVILWDEVGEAEGTGIVHIAPGCGAEDFGLGKQFGLPAIAPLDEEGVFVDGLRLADRARTSTSVGRSRSSTT